MGVEIEPAVEIEQAAIDACERELNHLRRYRRVFNGVATIGPLLGLLGTVFGLIRSFNDVAAAGAMGRPDLLAGGFGEALITTAMGLLVAIPAMVLHSYFTSRVDRLAMRRDVPSKRAASGSSRLNAFTTRMPVKLSCICDVSSAVAAWAAFHELRTLRPKTRIGITTNGSTTMESSVSFGCRKIR